MTIEYLLEAYTRKSGNRINALSNKMLKAFVEKAKKSMGMSPNSNNSDEALDMILNLFKTAKNGYDIILAWWLYSSYKLRNNGTKKTLKVQIPFKNKTITGAFHVEDPDRTKIAGQCWERCCRFMAADPSNFCICRSKTNSR